MPIFLFLSIGCLIAAWLLPFHQIPWPTFGSEILTFISASFLMLSMSKNKISLPRPQLIILPMIAIPLLQFAFGQMVYLSNAILCTAYILMFYCAVIAGYNLSKTAVQREQVFKILSLILLAVGLVSSVIAIFQWLHLNSYFSPWMYNLKGNRPYANMAQPNNLATLLIVSLMACVYFYEKKSIKNIYLIPFSLILLFSVALTQSRTAWVFCIFIVIYLGIKQFKQAKRLSFLKLLGCVAVFIAFIASLPLINHGIALISNQDLVDTASVIERASSGYLRLDMWSQVSVAISQQPWFGYGWNQTGMAQIAAFDAYPTREWYKSAHNIVFDLILWNGLIIGGLIVVYFTAWLYWLNQGAKDTVSIVATLMVCAILIHGLLEFPLHYAYFLFPAGFLLGIIQAEYPKLPSIQLNGKWWVLIAVITLSCTLISVRDYFLYREQSRIASVKTPLTASQKAVMQREIILLTQFKQRVWWIQLDPKTKMNEAELTHLDRMVANMASKYDLYKYAQVLAFNGQQAEAQHQLWILATLHRQERNYADLLK